MVRFLIDCDVLIDFVSERQPHVADSARVFDYASERPGCAAVAWHSVANVAYILRKQDIRVPLLKGLAYLEVAAGDVNAVVSALSGPMTDIEDALQAAAAATFGADYIVTRDVGDFVNSPIQAVTPTEFLQLVATTFGEQANG